MRSSIERRASQIEVPDLGDESLVLAGVNDFEEMCVQCHGAPGKKPAAVGQGLNPPAPDLAKRDDGGGAVLGSADEKSDETEHDHNTHEH